MVPVMARVRGFTLLEILVTLVIVSLLVTALMQALGHSLGLRNRLLRLQAETRLESLQEGWFRESVGAAVPDAKHAGGEFDGKFDRLSFVSLAPLASAGPARVTWTLRKVPGGSALHYADIATLDWRIIPGPLTDAAFEYLDAKGAWVREWKPIATEELAMPRLVRFSANTAKGRLHWLVPLPVERLRPELSRTDEGKAANAL